LFPDLAGLGLRAGGPFSLMTQGSLVRIIA